MATQLFIKDESGVVREEWVKTERVNAMVDAGWKLDPSELEAKTTKRSAKKAANNDDQDQDN